MRNWHGLSSPFGGWHNSAGGGPITPSQLESGTWLDVNDLSSMWQDAGGTVAVTTNLEPVGLIENQRETFL